MFDHERVMWPNVLFWVTVVLLVVALFYPIMLVNLGRELTAVELGMSTMLQFMLAILVTWRMATVTARGNFNQERRELARTAIRKIGDIGKSTERLRALVEAKRELVIEADTVLVREEYLAHLESVLDDIYDSVLGTIEEWVDAAELDVTRVSYIRELRIRLEGELEEKQRHLAELRDFIAIISKGDSVVEEEYQLLIQERTYEVEAIRARLSELNAIKPATLISSDPNEQATAVTGRLPAGVTRMYRRVLDDSRSSRA